MAVSVKILARSLLNPRPDLRRSARNFGAVALWPAGTVFADLGTDIFVESSPGRRFHCVALTGVQAQLLRRHLRDVTTENALEALLRDGPRWAVELLHEGRAGAAELGRMLVSTLMREVED